MSLVNVMRSGIGWMSQRNRAVRELIKAAKAQRLKLKSSRANAEFVSLHPGEPWPPLDLMADAHAHTDYRLYYESGHRHARVHAEMFARHFDFAGPSRSRIFEWGCGSGRILRHLRKHYDPGVELIGSDYNPQSVEWCKKSYPEMTFFQNAIAPPLELADNSIDIAYCCSVLTHLPEDLCRQWIAELTRIVRPGGLISFTIAGWNFAYRYQKREREQYRRGVPVYHEWDEAGKRDFFSWHPPEHVRGVFLAGLHELEYMPSEISGHNQDVWLAEVPDRPNTRSPHAPESSRTGGLRCG